MRKPKKIPDYPLDIEEISRVKTIIKLSYNGYETMEIKKNREIRRPKKLKAKNSNLFVHFESNLRGSLKTVNSQMTS